MQLSDKITIVVPCKNEKDYIQHLLRHLRYQMIGNTKIINLAVPTNPTDAANKDYVDSVAQGLNIKASVYVATYAALSAYTYNNGTDGVGATITANAFGALVGSSFKLYC